MKKRLLASLLTLCMVLTLLPAMTPAAKAAGTGVWVNGVDLSAGIATNCGGGTATYNKDTKTLTLNNAQITAGHVKISSSYGILVESPTDSLTIQLEGSSSISSSDSSVDGICLSGNLTISGGGSLTITALLPVDSNGKVQIENTVFLNLTATGKSKAIMASGGITFGNVPYSGQHSKLIYNRGALSFPISTLYVNNVNMLDSSTTKPANVTFDASTNTLTLNGAAITAAYHFDGYSFGIYADSNLTINLVGTNSIVSTSAGIQIDGDLAFTGNGSLTVNTAYDSISGNSTLTVNGGVTLSATSTGKNAIVCSNLSKSTITIRSGATVTASSSRSGLYANSHDESATITIEQGAQVKVTTTGNDPLYMALDTDEGGSITIGGEPYRGNHKTMDYDGVHFPFPPTMTSLTPSGTGSPTSGNIVVTFDTAMNKTKGTVSLNALSALTGGGWSGDAKTYTVPYSGLAGNTLYTVKLEGFEGGIGNLFPTNTEKSFTTTNKTVVDGSITLTPLSKPYTGAELDFPATLTGGNPSTNPHWTYTYTPLDGDILGTHGKPVNAGPYTVAVTYEDDANTGRKTFNIEVTPIDYILTMVTTDSKNTYTYGDVIPFKVTATPTDAITSGSSVYFDFGGIDAGIETVSENNAFAHNFATAGEDVVPGSYTVTATRPAMGNYKEAKATLSLTLNAQPLTATATKVYDGTASFTNVPLTLGNIINGDAVTATASFAAENANAGNHVVASPTVTLAGARSAYYAAPDSVTATITAKTVSAPNITADPATYVQTGSAIIPTSVVVKDVDKVIPASEYTLFYSNNIAVGEATITVTDKTGGNYNVNGTGHFTISDKTTVTVNMDGITLENKDYDGTAIAYTGDATGAYGSSTPYTGTFTYEWYQDSVKLGGAPTAAGSYTLKATVSDSNYAGEGTKAVTIAQRPVTITADNKEMLISAAEPTYTATTANLASGETISGVTFTVTNKNTAEKGNYPIVPAGGTITGGNANYTISYVDGTLAVKVDVTAIDTAIADANLAKTGVTANEGEPSAVASGTKFVKAAELKALTDAIKTATDAKGTVGNAVEAAAAAAALTNAVTPFAAAIKTGTYVAPSGGGTVTPPVPKPEPPKTDPGTGNTEVSVPVKPVTKGDTSSATVPEKSVSDAIAAAEKEAAKTGGSSSVTISVDAPEGAKTVETTLPSKSLSAVAEGKTEGLKISTPVADLSFDSEALKNIAGMAGKDVKISATQVDTTALTDAQKSQVGDAPVFDFTVTSGDKTISNFNGGTATVSVPYTPKEGENPEFVTVWLLDDAGKLIPIEASYKDGKIAFETGHFSRYAIGYLPFTDVKSDWAYESIVYVYQNKLFSGVGDDKFAPTDNMNRAMLWTVLYRMAGSPGKTETPANWYADAQAWAIAEKISDGTNPDGNITREQLATILWRYAQSKKQDVSIGEDTNILSYDDFDQMSQYAIPALQWACGAGVITGKSDSVLDPAGNATRAEVAAMLQRYAGLNK